MAIRLIELHRILKPTGSIYFHCDQTMSHYIKILMDVIFGEEHFRNEIIWYYRKFGQAGNNFKKNHDVLLWYSKSNQYQYHKQYEDFSPKTQKDKYKRILVDGRWVQDKNTLMADVRAVDGVAMGNVWEISFINSQSKERVGYPTQKPLALLRRIIQANSNPDDIVLDPFCGCATSCVAAEQLGRQWVGIDISEQAYTVAQERFANEVEADATSLAGNITHRTDIPARSDQAPFPPTIAVKHVLYGRQEGVCAGCSRYFDYCHLAVEPIAPKSKGGVENKQLLCSSCR